MGRFWSTVHFSGVAFTRNQRNDRFVRRLVIGVIGGTVSLLGVALLILPGPAFIVLPLGLAILGVEFAWARRLLRRVREAASRRR